MGRSPGAKNKTTEDVPEVNGNVIVSETVDPQEFKETAIGYARVEKNGNLRYLVYEVKFDINSKTLGSVEIVEDCVDSDNAIHRLRVLMGDKFL